MAETPLPSVKLCCKFSVSLFSNLPFLVSIVAKIASAVESNFKTQLYHQTQIISWRQNTAWKVSTRVTHFKHLTGREMCCALCTPVRDFQLFYWLITNEHTKKGSKQERNRNIKKDRRKLSRIKQRERVRERETGKRKEEVKKEREEWFRGTQFVNHCYSKKTLKTSILRKIEVWKPDDSFSHQNAVF